MITKGESSCMSFERYERFYLERDEGAVLRPMGKEKKFSFSLDFKEDKNYKLFVAGEVGLFYQWKNEPDYPLIYRSIEDCLSGSEAERSAYALSFTSEKPELFVRRAYKKILWAPRLSYLDLVPLPDDWDVGFYVKAKGLKVNTVFGGYLRMRINVRYIKEGVSIHSNLNPPDCVYIIDVPEGDYEYRRLDKRITLPKGRIASVGVYLEGVNYSGEVYIESPFFVGGGYNILPDFAPAVQGKSHFDWTGQNFSKKEWPKFLVTLNGVEIFKNEVFERCHRDSEWEVSLPKELLKSENEITLRLVSDYREPLPYTVHEIGVIEQEGGAVSLVATSEIGTAGGYAYALIRTEKDGVELKTKTDENIYLPESISFEKAGLHGIKIFCKNPSGNESFELSYDKITLKGTVARIVEREEDGVYTGTGDMIYVHQDMDSAEEFLCWYISSGIGNLLTVRPSYRWSGTRVVDRKMWREVTRVLNELDMIYPHMLDGRELPGLNANPDPECISGEGYVGRQMHERDGAMFYWRRYDRPNDVYSEQYSDMEIEIYREDKVHTNPDSSGKNLVFVPVEQTAKDNDSVAPTFEGDEVDAEKLYDYKNPEMPKDMKLAHDYTVGRLKDIKSDDATRHTGPSVTFKYFYEAGFDWVGAETMYGTLEEIMAFERGAALSNGKKDIGVHHALQWSSSPHEAPEHMRRYRIALYSSYMQGATEINTEEGLWRLEEYFSRHNRFSDACLGHTKEQQDFFRYLKSHTRRGKFYTPMGLIHGRYDGFNGFARNALWGFKNVTDTYAEKSWDLLSVFYPEGTLGDPTYCHNCPTDRALGFNASTPNGNVDVLPVENGKVFENYKAVAFMGYNCFEKSDFDALYSYVRQGGRLLLTLAHMTDTTDYEALLEADINVCESKFGFTRGKAEIETKALNGRSVRVATNIRKPNSVLYSADDGTPLAVTYKYGDGEVTLVCAAAFPADPAISEIYKTLLATEMETVTKNEYVWAKSSQGTQFAVYDRGEERDVYFLACDWYRAPERMRSAELRIGKATHTLSFPFGTMIKASVWKEYAAYPHTENAEVISVKNGIARIQGAGRVTFSFIKGAEKYDKTVDFTAEAVQEIKI